MSFLSYDWLRGEFVGGKFHRTDRTQGRLNRFTKEGFLTENLHTVETKMQGATSFGSNIWIARSYGKGNESEIVSACEDPMAGMGRYNKARYTYPPGLEDLHASFSSNNLWMLTEFGPHEREGPDGESNHRWE